MKKFHLTFLLELSILLLKTVSSRREVLELLLPLVFELFSLFVLNKNTTSSKKLDTFLSVRYFGQVLIYNKVVKANKSFCKGEINETRMAICSCR